MVTLSDQLRDVLGAKAAEQLHDVFGFRTVNDLLRHYPRSYAEGTAVRDVAAERPPEGEHITLVDTITGAVAREMKAKPGDRRRREYLVVTVGSGRRKVTATFFNASGLKWKLKKGTRVMLSGEVGYFNRTVQLTHPGFLVLDTPGRPADAKNFGSNSLRNIADASRAVSGEVLRSEFERDCYPIYPASTKLQSWDIFACVRQVLEVLDPIADALPAELRNRYGLIPEDQALRAVHLGQTAAQRCRALDRLIFDEAVGMQWALAGRRHGELAQPGPLAAPIADGLAAKLLRQLPFALTAGQREVLDVLTAELGSARPMNRLLQGEVGSGKTVVALLAMMQMVDAGYQCVLLAPTEVLAAQHVRSICDVLGELALGGLLGGADNAITVALLTGSMTPAQKKQVRAQIGGGDAGIVVGTHALLQDSVEFHRLGMVVIDEQHRFGVEQRDLLRAKAPVGITPHLLVMTATPIPRTVALTRYGDLETSTLRELPRGRQPITTSVIPVREKPAWLDRAWQRIREEVSAGRQAYVVAPRIDETDNAGPPAEGGTASATAVELFSRLQSAELSGLRLGLMHGRLPAERKDAVMAQFRSAAIDVLVCTTVIEVGVDVPNATLMLVMDADRFGISQLHQLRGRIGRGSHPSLCLLATWASSVSTAGRRLQAVADTLDGFVLADLDFRARREGDVLGNSQSGRRSGLKLLSLVDHGEIIETARDFCIRAYAEDPDDPGLALLASEFTNGDRIEYLEKA